MFSVTRFLAWPIALVVSIYFAVAAAERCFMALLESTAK